MGLLLAGWLAGWWLLWRLPLLPLSSPANPDASPPGTPPPAAAAGARTAPVAVDVSVVIPARNEAGNLPVLLESLVTQSVAPREVIVVDDCSTDDTATIATMSGATVIEGQPLPEGWAGKSWACAQGAAVATSARLVFLDADVRLLPGGLAAALAAHEAQGGLLSVQPYHRMRRAYERLSALFNVIAVMGVGVASPLRRGRTSGAFGPCVVCDTATYRSVGGHAAVRGEVLEDLALGALFDAAGVPTRGAGGRHTIEFRMYPDGVGQLIAGWTKNFASGSATIGRLRLVLSLLWVSTLVGTAVEALWWLTGTGNLPTLAVWAAWAAVATQLRLMFRQLGNFGWWPALAYPVVVAVFLAVFARSLWCTVVRRRVEWRGRHIPVGGRARPGSSSDAG
jgi:4,4'-diaponeurosporenoate glycosyltransferase